MLRPPLALLFSILPFGLSAQSLIECAPTTCHVRVLNADQVIPKPKGDGLVVTGTYSSGDEYGIEGLAIIEGEVERLRYQSWDGMLVIDNLGHHIYPRQSVRFNGKIFDTTNFDERVAFIKTVKDAKGTVIQSHLVINDGALDIVESAEPRFFVRRFLYERNDGSIGIYQTETPKSLYEASVELNEKLAPKMAMNLDMGAYDFCEKYTVGEPASCGSPTAGFDALTNLIMIEKK